MSAGENIQRARPRRTVDPPFHLPTPADLDGLDAATLVDILTALGALTERARARLALGVTTSTTPAPADEYLTAEMVGQILNAEPSWIYRHRAALGGVKLDGILRFSRRRFEAYLTRQQRLGDA